jgi:hypothetical protein
MLLSILYVLCAHSLFRGEVCINDRPQPLEVCQLAADVSDIVAYCKPVDGKQD